MRAKVAAAERIRAVAGYAAALLVGLMADPAVDVKLRADLARDILTRAGIEEAKRIEIAATVEAPWQKLVGDGGAIRVLHLDQGRPAAAPAAADDDIQPAHRELELRATPTTPVAPPTAPRREPVASPVPPSDSPAAEAAYRASRNAPDPAPTSAVQRVDGARPRMSERQRRRRA